jgi:hypothetical protein
MRDSKSTGFNLQIAETKVPHQGGVSLRKPAALPSLMRRFRNFPRQARTQAILPLCGFSVTRRTTLCHWPGSFFPTHRREPAKCGPWASLKTAIRSGPACSDERRRWLDQSLKIRVIGLIICAEGGGSNNPKVKCRRDDSNESNSPRWLSQARGELRANDIK